MHITNHVQEAVNEARGLIKRYTGGRYFEGGIDPFVLAHWLGYVLLPLEDSSISDEVEFIIHDYGYAGERIIEYRPNTEDYLGMAVCVGHIWLGHLKNLDNPVVDIYSWGSILSPIEVETASAFGREIMEVYYD